MIIPIYEEGTDNIVHSISDTKCKHLLFSRQTIMWERPLIKLSRNSFQIAFKIASQNNLSHRCRKEMICRKMSSTSSFVSWLEANNLQKADVDLGMFFHFIESKFSLHSTPEASFQTLPRCPNIITWLTCVHSTFLSVQPKLEIFAECDAGSFEKRTAAPPIPPPPSQDPRHGRLPGGLWAPLLAVWGRLHICRRFSQTRVLLRQLIVWP